MVFTYGVRKLYYLDHLHSNNSQQDVDNYTLNVWIFIKPTKAIEFIPTKVILTRTDLSFGLAAALL